MRLGEGSQSTVLEGEAVKGKVRMLSSTQIWLCGGKQAEGKTVCALFACQGVVRSSYMGRVQAAVVVGWE